MKIYVYRDKIRVDTIVDREKAMLKDLGFEGFCGSYNLKGRSHGEYWEILASLLTDVDSKVEVL